MRDRVVLSSLSVELFERNLFGRESIHIFQVLLEVPHCQCEVVQEHEMVLRVLDQRLEMLEGFKKQVHVVLARDGSIHANLRDLEED